MLIAELTCPRCGGLGYLDNGIRDPLERGFGQSVQCPCVHEEHPELRYTFAKYNPRTPSQKKARLKAQAWAKGELTFLTLSGLPGIGKSHLARAAAFERRARYFTMAEMLNWLRQGYEETAQTSFFALKTSLCSDIPLVIDDLGAEAVKEWGIEQIQTILEDRIVLLHATLLTTNYGMEDLAGRLSRRVASRVFDVTTAGHEVCIMLGEDYRTSR